MLRNRRFAIIIGVLVVGFIGLQIVAALNPNWARTNPEVTYTVAWDSERTEDLVRRACFDCHSNETVWPWYSQIAPMSILVARDVAKGRGDLNFSTNHNIELDEMIEQIESGAMPLPIYLPLHPEANLSDEEKTDLINGLRATFGGEQGESEDEGSGGEENETGESDEGEENETDDD